MLIARRSKAIKGNWYSPRFEEDSALRSGEKQEKGMSGVSDRRPPRCVVPLKHSTQPALAVFKGETKVPRKFVAFMIILMCGGSAFGQTRRRPAASKPRTKVTKKAPPLDTRRAAGFPFHRRA
jgi:hypothetical protein